MNKGYAKQFCIYGRLLFHCGREREAILEIKRAIDLENSENRDSFIRITQYYDYINQIKISSAYSRAKRLGAMSLALGALALGWDYEGQIRDS